MTLTRDAAATAEPNVLDEPGPLLEVVRLSKTFRIRRRGMWAATQQLRAVDDVSLRVHRGQTLAIVGESGCGKSTTARMIALLEPPTAGEIRLGGQDMRALRGAGYVRERRRVQMVFQDAMSSLDPRMRVRNSIAEPLTVSGVPRPRRERRVDELLEQVGLDLRVGDEYPHALSGGQCQRVGIARALALGPDVLVADEPTSALDLSIRAQIVNLLRRIQRELDVAMVFISHDMGTVRHIADRVAVMYLGRVVEEAPTADLFGNPLHPYTRALLSAVPVPDPEVERQRQWKIPEGDVPNPVDPPAGCAFHPRCPHATETCLTRPQLAGVTPERVVACHYADQWVGNKRA